MIFDEIILKDFGVYGGKQSAILTPQENRPIVLFGGLNGGGKTTLLDAVQLAFYGANARTSNRGKLPYKDYLARTIHRGADTGDGASITIRFRRVIDGMTRHFELVRSWRQGVKGIEEFVEVSCDGERDAVLSEHWAEYIEGYLPSGVAHLFFFDAEQIKELAEGEHATQILGAAIHSLLGLDLVDRLDADLRVLERRKKAEGLDPVAAARLEECKVELRQAHHELENLVQKKGVLTNEANSLAKVVAEMEKKYQAEGGDLFQKRGVYEEELGRLTDQKKQEEATLRELAAGPAPLLFVRHLLEEVETAAKHEAEIKQARLLGEALEARDRKLLQTLQGSIPANLSEKIEQLLTDDREALKTTADEPLILDAEPSLVPEIRLLREKILPSVEQQVLDRLASLEAFEEKISRVQSELVRVPDADAIASIQKDLTLALKNHNAKLEEILETETQIELAMRHKSAIESRIDRLGADKLDADEVEDDRLRILRHSERVRSTLQKFRERVVKRHAARLEALMLECFTRLLRKTGLVSRLEINPSTFEVALWGGDGHPLPVERLSSGERQLLATAMLWGLARASGRPIPTIIDTPLGRLDSSHRRHLVERYFPVASHQVLLLSTDEEIIENHLETLQPWLARTYHLTFDESQRHTQIQLGYFDHATTR
jgi:DNA sulfur modification protein DndD